MTPDLHYCLSHSTPHSPLAPRLKPTPPHPARSPSTRPTLATTPYQAPTPRTPANTLKGPITPVLALNPYDSNWTIKVKVLRKMAVRSIKTGRVMNAELVDEEVRGQAWLMCCQRLQWLQ